MHFNPGQSLFAAYQGKRAIRPECGIRKLCGTIASDPVADNGLHTEINLLGKERHIEARASPSAGTRIVESANRGRRSVGASDTRAGPGQRWAV